jgi:hypothetical protein
MLVLRFKARFVARGFSQQAWFDFTKTFSHVIRMTSLRLLLALATIYNYHIHDHRLLGRNLTWRNLHNATWALYHPRHCTVHQVCCLLKSLYGLKHVSRIWYKTFDTFLWSHGFLKCTSDPNIYIKRSHNSILFLGLYIDDLVIISDNFQFLTVTKAIFNQCFSMTDNNKIGYILGIQIQRDCFRKTLLLS